MEGSNITIAIAFAAGLLSFLTPCVLPLVPGYISLISGVSVEHLKGEGGGSRAAARLGVAFAAGWTPCIGPILGGIIGLAATSGGWKSGLVLSAFYAAGLAIPFLGVGLLMNAFLGFYGRFPRHLHK